MTALSIVSDAEPGDLSVAEWNRVLDHIRACWPYSRPWTVETQQAFYDVLRHYEYVELIGAASDLAKSASRRNDRERPTLAELRQAAQAARASLERSRQECALRVHQAPPRTFADIPVDPPADDAGPYTRLLYARATGQISDDPTERDRFLRGFGL